MSNFVPGAGVGPVSVVSRSTNKLDAFAVGLDGQVYTAAWEPGDKNWRGWWPIGGIEVAPCAPISAVSRSADKLDIFAVGIDGRVYTAAWEPGDKNWRGWWPIGDLVTVLHAPIGVVSRSANKLDIVVSGLDGRIYTAAWEPGDKSWRGWWPIGTAIVPPGAPVSLLSRSTDKLDVFVVGSDQKAYTAAWQPGDKAWRGWWPIGQLQLPPRTPITAVSRSKDMLDVFTVGSDGRVYTAAWQPGDKNWRGWWSVSNLTTTRRSIVSAVSRSANLLDVFATGLDGQVYTAAWQPGDTAWRGWWPVSKAQINPGTVVSAVSRSTNFLDVFTTGLQGEPYTAAWQPGDKAWRGWWPVGNLTTGMTDPGVNAWHKVGVALSIENKVYSKEAQGVTTDGDTWYLVSNGSKTIRRYGPNHQLLGEVNINNGKHIGAPGCHQGWVYVPVQGPFGVWKARTDLTERTFTPVDGGQDRFAWCDVNPLNGRLYTCEYDIYNNANGILYAYDSTTFARCPEDDIYLGKTPIHFDRIQGGVFTRRGRLIISRSEPNGIFCFSAVTGHCFGGKKLGDFGSSSSELEGVTVRSWQFNGVAADVHVLELDNDINNSDDCYLHSFQVPNRHRL